MALFNSIFRLFFLIPVFLFLVSTPSWAAGFNLESIKPLKPVELMPQEEFEAQTQLVQDTPHGDKGLAYQVRLPQGWGSDKSWERMASGGGLSSQVLGIIAEFISPAKMHLRSFFTIEALELTYEISARNWFINYLLNSGYSLEGLSEKSETKVEAVYVEVQGDVTYAVRVAAIINGPRILVARYYVPQQHYAEEKVMQAQVIDSFKLMNENIGNIEKLEIHGFLDQSYFNYPVSWGLDAPVIRSIERMRALLFSEGDNESLDGQINIYLVSRLMGTTMAEEVERYLSRLNIDNYQLGEMIEPVEMEYHPDINIGFTEAYEMNPLQPISNINYELWASILEGDDYYYMVTLLTPSRDEEFYIWARNIEAYEIIARTIRRYDEDVDYYKFIK